MNNIGLDINKTKVLSKELNDLLATYQVFYTNLRGFHWNIKGRKFFELHLKFEELYNDLQIKIDEIAERILTLGGTPNHAFSNYLEQAKIKETGLVIDGDFAMNNIIESFQITIKIQRNLLDISGEANDEGTNALMSDYIREQEKLVWMFTSFMA